MIRIILPLLFSLRLLTLGAQNGPPTGAVPARHDSYIRQFAPLAVDEMYYSGIPASIKLAQGILETSGGQSRLATEGYNHFGIKCKSYWTGDTLQLRDDDLDANGNLIESCFRCYDSPRESYRDHSDFLRNGERYRPLFQLDRTDYSAWANGLQQCGYATNPEYARKLVTLIERYHLHVFDRVPRDSSEVCLDYYDTKLYVERHREDTQVADHSAKPRSIRIPGNYRGGWLRENTRMRILTSMIGQSPATPASAPTADDSDDTFLSFEVEPSAQAR
jgi:hypothetical protein